MSSLNVKFDIISLAHKLNLPKCNLISNTVVHVPYAFVFKCSMKQYLGFTAKN